MSDFKAKMHQMRISTHWGSLQRSPDPVAVFKGPNSKGKGGEGLKKRNRKSKGRRRGGEEKGGGERLYSPLSQIPGYATATNPCSIATCQYVVQLLEDLLHNNTTKVRSSGSLGYNNL